MPGKKVPHCQGAGSVVFAVIINAIVTDCYDREALFEHVEDPLLFAVIECVLKAHVVAIAISMSTPTMPPMQPAIKPAVKPSQKTMLFLRL